MNISTLRSILSSSKSLRLTFDEVADTNILATSSFLYDSIGTGLKNTQQLNVDWSRFENHTFFMSAVAKVNIAFDQILNHYPFDGNRVDVEKFFENLTGFDKWVFDQFPKHKGSLHFSSSWIEVIDSAGAQYPSISSNQTGDSVLNPTDKSLTIEFHVKLPTEQNQTQFICQKISEQTEGYSVYILPSTSTSSCQLAFSIVSGSDNVTVQTELEKGKFNHVAATLNRENGVHFAQIVTNLNSTAVSDAKVNIGSLNIDSTSLLIGSGTSFMLGSTLLTSSQTLSGTIDEFRIFHSVRSQSQLRQYAKKNLFPTDDLRLYYKFNEPVLQHANNITIDSSGKSLHSYINNYNDNLRIDASEDDSSLMIYELDAVCPVMFPTHADVVTLNTELMLSASEYDLNNPNIITKLVPQHYLLNGAANEGLNGISTTQVDFSNVELGDDLKGSSQILLTFLYIYARFFDELKLYVDSFRNLRYVNYDQDETVPDNFLKNLTALSGFNIPSLFNDATIEQYLRAENIDQDISVSLLSLKQVQTQLLRRVLINMPDILRSKGTQHSIRAFLRAVGIDPDNGLRIIEYGGPTTKQLSFSREKKRNVGTMVKFTTSSYVISPFLSSSRTEPGAPAIKGSFVNGVSNNRSDGLFTSGSWSVDLIAKWNPIETNTMTSATQSLLRMAVTGSSTSEGVVANLIAISSSLEPRVMLYVRPGVSASSPTLSMAINTPLDDGLFNGDKWNISFGCHRPNTVNSLVSSSYFLRVGKQNDGEIVWTSSTSSFFQESTSELNVFRSIDSTNVSGAFFVLGEGREIDTSITRFLNASTNADATSFSFNGLLSNLRFWSYGMSEQEFIEHVKNANSFGVNDPSINYNFIRTTSGSFERLRLDSLGKQQEKTTDDGTFTFFDFSQNNMHLLGQQFDDNVLVGELFERSYLSPYFDEASTNEKIRARSFLSLDNVLNSGIARLGPLYEIERSERPTDDVRFSIEFSLVDALNRDIVSMFSTFEAMENAIGNPELLFSQDYPTLDRLRMIYFNRLREKLNFKAFFEFYSWFDTSISTMIQQLIPRKTNYKGTNFTVESHVLERHKLEYFHNEIYLADSDRASIDDRLLLQQFFGILRKY